MDFENIYAKEPCNPRRRSRPGSALCALGAPASKSANVQLNIHRHAGRTSRGRPTGTISLRRRAGMRCGEASDIVANSRKGLRTRGCGLDF